MFLALCLFQLRQFLQPLFGDLELELWHKNILLYLHYLRTTHSFFGGVHILSPFFFPYNSAFTSHTIKYDALLYPHGNAKAKHQCSHGSLLEE